MAQFGLKRAYEKPETDDGLRILVDRIWPRGISKAELKLDVWLKEIAPTTELRRWFGHDVERWDEFRSRYFDELDGRKELVDELLGKAERGPVTLIFAARDVRRNNAVALREYLARKNEKLSS